MNGFERHGLTHSSASQINQWADAPCAWISQYLYGNRGKFSPAAKAGVLVEEAVVNVLARGFPADRAIVLAQESYNKFTALAASDSDRKRGDGLADMISLALTELAPFGTPEFDRDGVTGDAKQKKVEVTCNGDGWTLPLIGFIDFHFPKHGLIVDLKTTAKMPSEMSGAHLRQRAIYRKAFGNQDVKFLYITPKKAQMFSPDGFEDTLKDVKTLLNRQERFLNLGDKELLRTIVPVNTETYYWTGNESTRRSLYGI